MSCQKYKMYNSNARFRNYEQLGLYINDNGGICGYSANFFYIILFLCLEIIKVGSK